MGTKKYSVSMPITGFVHKEIEAESKEEALDKFYQMDTLGNDIEEWNYCEEIVTGNVFNGHLNRVDIEEVD